MTEDIIDTTIPSSAFNWNSIERDRTLPEFSSKDVNPSSPCFRIAVKAGGSFPFMLIFEGGFYLSFKNPTHILSHIQDQEAKKKLLAKLA